MANDIQVSTASALITEEEQFEVVRDIINLHRSRAARVINDEAVQTFWHVGAYVSHQLRTQVWGSAVVSRLSEYLRVKDPSLKGYGRRNIYNMVAFYEAYTTPEFNELLLRIGQTDTISLFPAQSGTEEHQIVQTNSAQLLPAEFVQTNSAQLPKLLTLTSISHHMEIITRCKTASQRLFYILYTHRERLKYKELQRVITNDAYGSIVGGDKSNLSQALKEQYPDSPLQLRDTIYIDLLGLPQKFKETRLRKAMVEHMKQFILELGKDFLFMEEEYRLPVGSSTFKSDLLFYHRGLQCLVAVELKTGKFHPRDLGQLEFYLEALDRDVKRSNENPSIGILLCREADSLQVEYALSRSMSPTMVAEYQRLLIPKEVLQAQIEEYAQIALGGSKEQ